MSWLGEAWQEGLSARALQGVRELEQRLEWANKERLQKQAQLDTLEASLHKQRQKHEEERGTWVLLARERRDLAEACEQQEREHQQLSRELQAKGAQLSQLEGQLGRAAQRIEELEEELRRCQAELDNLRSSTHLTHCWAPWKEGAELGTWEQNPRLENRPRTPSMRLQPSSPKLGEEPLIHQGAAWHSVPPGGPAPTEDSQRIPSPREEPREENAGPGRGPPDMEAWELRGELQSVQRELAQCTEQRNQAVAKVSALERRVQQLLEELRSQMQRAGAAQRRLEQQEREHRQELVELERHHREVLEQQGTQSDIPAPPHHPPNKGLGGSERERHPPGCVRHSLSTSRLERVPEKRGAAGKVRGSSAQGPRAVGRLVPSGERGREPEPHPELQALRAEVLGLRRRLAASESLRKGLLETCWQLHQGARDLAGERWALAEMLPAQDATMQHKEDPQELRGAPGPSLAKGEGRELQALAVELEAQVWGAPGPGLPRGDAQEVGELQVLRGALRALALGKAEAEAQAQERLRRLQETLGLQTERLARACEAQSQHVAGLLMEGYERERELERLSQALGEAGWVRGLLEAEVGHLRVLLGGETPPTPLPEPPPTVPEAGPPELPPTVPEAGPPELPPTVPEPGPPELPPTVPEPGSHELPPTVPEPGSHELPPTIPESSPPEPPATSSAELPPTVPEPRPAELPPTVPEPSPPELPPTIPESSPP
ncbi:WW domain-binding protein 11-like [Dermochelys coriacea]|uniref:WW domain-binding protein 11-like n=1 Tax=Dermochelys coriacea TaxID=27794 RepID=UPI0018E7AA06|nr:WW domain-binding protein 11-like [Dermochelys coriacea]